MPKVINAIQRMNSQEKELTKEVSKSWNDMMSTACVRSLLRLRILVLKFTLQVGNTKEVRKHVEKLRTFSVRIAELEAMELNSINYKPIFASAKKITEEFETWQRGSITNVISTPLIQKINEEVDKEVSKAA